MSIKVVSPAVLCLLLCFGCAEKSVEKKEAPRVRVKTTPIVKREFSTTLNLLSTLQASDYATVCAKTSGIYTSVPAIKGLKTIKDETILFEVDPRDAENNLKMAKETLATMSNNLLVAKATLEKVKADFYLAETNYYRYRSLENKGVTSSGQMQQYESAFLQGRAELKLREANIATAEQAIRQAVAALAIAQKTFEDTVVRAPYTGYVGWANKMAGDYARVGDPVCYVADTYHLEMWAAVPAAYYPLVKENETKFTVRYNGETIGTYPIAMRAPTIDETLRTFDIKGYLTNESGNLVPGTLVQIEMTLETHEGLAVPEASVLHRREKDLIYVLENGNRVKEIEVQKGLTSNGQVEVKAPELKEGMRVLEEGQTQIANGSVVEVGE